MKKNVFWLLVILSLNALQLKAQTVYITKITGMYQAPACRYLNQSKYPIELRDALKKKYTPCKLCNPSQTISESTMKDSEIEKSDPETTLNTATHCSVTEKKANVTKT